MHTLILTAKMSQAAVATPQWAALTCTTVPGFTSEAAAASAGLHWCKETQESLKYGVQCSYVVVPMDAPVDPTEDVQCFRN
jgi:hypothetical protein